MARSLRHLLRRRPVLARPSIQEKPFSSISQRRAEDPLVELKEVVHPTKAPRPDSTTPVSARPAGVPSDGRNPHLQGYPSADGTQTTSTATPDSTTPSAPASQPSSSRNPLDSLSDLLSGTGPGSSRRGRSPWRRPSYTSPSRAPPSQQQQQQRPRNPALVSSLIQTLESNDQRIQTTSSFARSAGATAARALEAQLARRWVPGDVYAPHDLSGVEQAKARAARSNNSLSDMVRGMNSRQRGAPDVFDQLALDPRREYANFAMMGEFVSEMGRIRGARETGLRRKNQRRLAKAVRRAVGMGLMPSVHRHPELFVQRREVRQQIAAQRRARGI